MAINIKLMEMRQKVKDELEHIPKGNLHQNMLRQAYFSIRMNSLGKKAELPDDRNKVLKYVIDLMKKYCKEKGEEFKPKYDTKFFKLK